MKKSYLLFAAISLLLWLIPRGMCGQEEVIDVSSIHTLTGPQSNNLRINLLEKGQLILDNVIDVGMVNAIGGTIILRNTSTIYGDPVIKNLTINGDVTIIGDNQKDHSVDENGNGTTGNPFCPLSDNIQIQGGKVRMSNINIRHNSSFEITGGEITMEYTLFTQNDFTNNKVKAAIIQKGGKLILKENWFNTIMKEKPYDPTNEYLIEVSGGTCQVEGTITMGDHVAGSKGLFNITDKGSLHIKNGTFKKPNILHYPSDFQPIAIHSSENGNVAIDDGKFDSNPINISGGSMIVNGGKFKDNPICIEGGYLEVNGGEFNSVTYNGKTADIHVLSDADIALSGGKYDKGVYIDPAVTNVTPENILAEGYGYFTLDQKLQPDVQYKPASVKAGDYILIHQIKSLTEEGPANNCREAALSAIVGPEGTDVKVIAADSRVYEINTPKGLCWLMTALNGYWDNIYKVTPPLHDYHKISNNDIIRLTADLDMSAYDWIPIGVFTAKQLDGQMHRIYNLKVNQACATFIQQLGYGNSPTPTEIANLIINGTFNGINTIYEERLNLGAFGLTANNAYGQIVNCGVENSTLTCDYQNTYLIRAGGLAGINNASIQNSYFSGSISCKVEYTESLSGSVSGSVYQGGLVGQCNPNGFIDNSYVLYEPSEPTIIVSEGLTNNVTPPYSDYLVGNINEANTNNCFAATDPSKALKALNKAVDEYEIVENETVWKTWICEEGRNDNYPIHGEDKNPSYIDMPFTLKVEGPGKLEGYYLTYEGEEPNITEKKVYLIENTAVYFTNGRTFHIKAIPDENASFDRLTQMFWGDTTEIELKDFTAKEEYTNYKANAPTILTAYFIKKKLVIDEDKESIGGEENEEKVEEIEISVPAKQDGTPSTITISNVTVSTKNEEQKALTTITNQSKVVLQLSGSNTLGKLVNEGQVELNVIPGKNAELTVTEVINKGTLIDNTGLIQEVKDESNTTLLALSKSNGDAVYTGEAATLTASASIPSDASVTFQWQRKDGNSWKNEGKATTYPEQTPQVRAANLRATTPLIPSYTNTHQTTALTNEGSYAYRCLITTANSSVSTTLSTYTQVTVSVKSEENPNPNPTPDPTPSYTYYNIILPEVAGATLTPSPGTYSVREGDNFSFSLALEADYNLSVPVVKAGDKELTPEGKGGYKISNVTSNLTVSITGITLNTPTATTVIQSSIRVWSNETILYLYSETPETARIISFAGEVLKTVSVNGSVEVSGLPHGNYLICIKERIFKIVL